MTPHRGRWARLIVVPKTSPPSFTEWSSFPFEGELRVKQLDDPVAVEPPRKGENKAECPKCLASDDMYIWVSDNWRVRSLDRPSGLPMVLILESRSHLDLGDLSNMLAAELGVMTVRLERAIRSLEGVARVHVNRWGDAASHLHVWFMARPYGRLQLRGSFLTLWDEILPPIPEEQWRENLAMVAAWLAEFGGTPLAEPPHINWQAPSSLGQIDPNPPPTAEPTAEPPATAEPAVATTEPAANPEPAGTPEADPSQPVATSPTAGSPGPPATPQPAEASATSPASGTS